MAWPNQYSRLGLMRLTLTRSGGFAGLQRPPLTVDTEDMPPAQARLCEQLLREVRFFELPTRQAEPEQPDRFQYAIEVVGECGPAHTVTFGEAGAPALLLELARLIQKSSRGKK